MKNIEADVQHVVDDVYGDFDVSSALLNDLLESKAVNRLKEVTQAGASSLLRPGRTVTRYEHSVGVMILVSLLGGSEREQAAGLLQDVSHTAFSHTIDYVFRDRREEFHEQIFETVVERSDIPAVLAGHGLVWRDLFTPANLRRVDAPAPLLCADRIDYTLRDLIRFGHITSVDAQDFLHELEFRDGVVCVRNEEAAWVFVKWYTYLVDELFMNPLELYAHDKLAEIIREALKAGVLDELDLLCTDKYVLDKLAGDRIHGSAAALDRLTQTRNIEVNDPSGRRVFSKARVVDPPILHDKTVVPLSSVRDGVKLLSTRILAKAREGILIGNTC